MTDPIDPAWLHQAAEGFGAVVAQGAMEWDEVEHLLSNMLEHSGYFDACEDCLVFDKKRRAWVCSRVAPRPGWMCPHRFAAEQLMARVRTTLRHAVTAAELDAANAIRTAIRPLIQARQTELVVRTVAYALNNIELRQFRLGFYDAELDEIVDGEVLREIDRCEREMKAA